MNPKIKDQANRNYSLLGLNAYPGRLIIIGMDKTGQYLVQAYAIMGRSDNSRNRVFEFDKKTGRLWTAAADEAKVEDPSLIIYNAMAEVRRPQIYVVSNGDQTDTIVDHFRGDGSFHSAVSTREYEPDAPNFTPRISGACYPHRGGPRAQLSILRKSPFCGGCDRQLFEIEGFEPGIGYCIHTYRGDGDPLPPFQGEPYVLPLKGDIDAILNQYWDVLDMDNRVSLAIKFINIETRKSRISVKNKYEKVIAE